MMQFKVFRFGFYAWKIYYIPLAKNMLYLYSFEYRINEDTAKG